MGAGQWWARHPKTSAFGSEAREDHQKTYAFTGARPLGDSSNYVARLSALTSGYKRAGALTSGERTL
jgi:hypothetical protein